MLVVGVTSNAETGATWWRVPLVEEGPCVDMMCGIVN